MLKMLTKPSALAFLMVITGACILSSSCAQSKPPLEEKPIIPQTIGSTNPATPSSTSNLPSPEPGEINQAINRVFKGAVTIETNRTPYFLVGDFNGDYSQDLGVIVKPVLSKLLEINDEFANWILVDPVRVARVNSTMVPYREIHAETIMRRRPHVEEVDILLAVIHGFQSKGWRDSQATQTYVLRGSAGDKIRTLPHKQIGMSGDEEKFPRIWGDVI